MIAAQVFNKKKGERHMSLIKILGGMEELIHNTTQEQAGKTGTNVIPHYWLTESWETTESHGCRRKRGSVHATEAKNGHRKREVNACSTA